MSLRKDLGEAIERLIDNVADRHSCSLDEIRDILDRHDPAVCIECGDPIPMNQLDEWRGPEWNSPWWSVPLRCNDCFEDFR